MSQKTIKVKFNDITKRQQLLNTFDEQLKLIMNSFGLSYDSMKEYDIIFKNQEEKVLIINEKEFENIKNLIKTNEYKSSLKLELVKSQHLKQTIPNLIDIHKPNRYDK